MIIQNLTSSQRAIKLPIEVKERALSWVQSQAVSSYRTPQEAPFRRLIDFWFAAIAWALSKSLDPVQSARGSKFVSIGPTSQDVQIQTWKLDLLVILATRDFGHNDNKAQNPNDIIDLANRYAEVGAESLLYALEDSRQFAIPKLYHVTELYLLSFDRAIDGAPSYF